MPTGTPRRASSSATSPGTHSTRRRHPSGPERRDTPRGALLWAPRGYACLWRVVEMDRLRQIVRDVQTGRLIMRVEPPTGDLEVGQELTGYLSENLDPDDPRIFEPRRPEPSTWKIVRIEPD